MWCFITISVLPLHTLYKPAWLLAKACLFVCSAQIQTMFWQHHHVPQCHNKIIWPSPIKMVGSVIYNIVMEQSKEQPTGGNGKRKALFPMHSPIREGIISSCEEAFSPCDHPPAGDCKQRRQTVLHDTARTGSRGKDIISPSSGTTW